MAMMSAGDRPAPAEARRSIFQVALMISFWAAISVSI
jgi:hypothetical protein